MHVSFLLLLALEPVLAEVVHVTNSEAVRIVGRTARVPDKGVHFDWPGTRFVASLSGTHLEVVLTEYDWTTGNLYDVEVDGASSVLQTRVGKRVAYTLATNLSPGSHLVLLTKRTEGGPALLHWFWADGPGDSLPPPPKHRVLFIGDSICAGSGALGKISDCDVTDITLQSSGAAFAMLSLDLLQAEGHLACSSGKGIVRNWGQPRERWGLDPTMAILWKQILVANASAGNWDCTAWVPHVIVIHIGTNDYSTANGPRRKEYVNALLKLLLEVWSACGDADIPVILACGPLWGDLPYRYMSEVASKFDTVSVADLRNGLFEDDLTMGCGCHPAYAAEKRMAKILAPLIAAAAEGRPTPTPAPTLVPPLPQAGDRCNRSECGSNAWCSPAEDTCKAIGDVCNFGRCGPGAWCVNGENVCFAVGASCNWGKCGTDASCSVCDNKCYETCYHTSTTCAHAIPRKYTYYCDYSGHGGRPSCGVTNDQCAGQGDNFPCPTTPPLANLPAQTPAPTAAPTPQLASTPAQTLTHTFAPTPAQWASPTPAPTPATSTSSSTSSAPTAATTPPLANTPAQPPAPTAAPTPPFSNLPAQTLTQTLAPTPAQTTAPTPAPTPATSTSSSSISTTPTAASTPPFANTPAQILTQTLAPTPAQRAAPTPATSTSSSTSSNTSIGTSITTSTGANTSVFGTLFVPAPYTNLLGDYWLSVPAPIIFIVFSYILYKLYEAARSMLGCCRMRQ